MNNNINNDDSHLKGGGFKPNLNGNNKIPKRIIPKLNEDEEYEYLDSENPYKSHYDSGQGGVSTVGIVDGDSSETKSPIDTTAVRNQYWMDHTMGGRRGFNYSLMTTKGGLPESVKVLKYLTERDVMIVPGEQNQEMPMEEDPNAVPMEGEEGMEEMPMEEDPNAEMDMGAEEGMEEDPNITALMDLLQQSADPDIIEAVKKYAEGIIKSKEEDAGAAPMEEDPNMDMGAEEGMEEMPMEEDPNAMPPQQQTESRNISLDEIISDYFNDNGKTPIPTVSKNTGNLGNKTLKSKMFNPI